MTQYKEIELNWTFDVVVIEIAVERGDWIGCWSIDISDDDDDNDKLSLSDEVDVVSVVDDVVNVVDDDCTLEEGDDVINALVERYFGTRADAARFASASAA